MSSYTGSITDTDVSFADQLAPVGDAPDLDACKAAFARALIDTQPYVDQCRLNYQTRYALWSGQSADGKKHSREGAKIDPTPWDGASDLRVYLNDNVINKKVAMFCMALRKANLIAKPIEGNDVKRAKVVSNFLRWLIRTQIPGLDREEELLANYLNEKGLAITGQFWEVCQQKTLKTVRLADLQSEFPQTNWQTIINSPDLADEIQALFEEIYGASAKKAKKMLVELRDSGTTTVPVVGKEKSYPVIRAFNLDNDIFVQGSTTDLETAPGIWRVQYFNPEQLRSFVNTDGWDKDWVEAAIEKCRGQLITNLNNQPENQYWNRSFLYTQQRFTNMVGVVYGYQRLSDEDGVTGIYLTIFHPNLAKDSTQRGYAKFGLLDYGHGKYPFVLHRREYLSRRIHDSRGIPEPGKPWQDQIKAHRDSRIDAASMRIIPPIFYPIGRPPSRWGPGSRVPERRPGEYHFGEGPPVDPVTDDSEDRLLSSFNEYNGIMSKDGDQTITPFENQFEVDKFMQGWAAAYNQVWQLYKQFGSEAVYFRVVGVQTADPIEFKKGNEDEEFDIMLTWDVGNLDTELTKTKVSSIIQLCQTLDREGTVNYSELLQWAMDTIDPNVAERILQPASIGTQQVVEQQQSDLAKLAAGINVNVKPGTPPQLAMQVMQNWLQGAPDVQQRLLSDEPFKQRVEAYGKQINMQLMQQQNAKIGRLGAAMPGQALQ